ncbi:hypothetical protein TorRG33x02_146990 [Trema orientale]|uniref:Uncharacterized protein n=1 Tax=Trema orientale TaxID=63057 RepID=A0A2P5EVM2_TREOI|nr:hypothetical protein TorRG33x02_146990 [Trema orientale]
MEGIEKRKARVYEVHNVVFSLRVPDPRRHNSFVREDREFVALGRKSMDVSSSVFALPQRKFMAAARAMAMA